MSLTAPQALIKPRTLGSGQTGRVSSDVGRIRNADVASFCTRRQTTNTCVARAAYSHFPLRLRFLGTQWTGNSFVEVTKLHIPQTPHFPVLPIACLNYMWSHPLLFITWFPLLERSGEWHVNSLALIRNGKFGNGYKDFGNSKPFRSSDSHLLGFIFSHGDPHQLWISEVPVILKMMGRFNLRSKKSFRYRFELGTIR